MQILLWIHFYFKQNIHEFRKLSLYQTLISRDTEKLNHYKLNKCTQIFINGYNYQHIISFLQEYS